MRERALAFVRTPEAGVLALFTVFVAVGCAWGLPGSDAFCADSISPRSCGLGAIAETYLPGHYHAYPPLQMAILTVVSLPWIALAASRVGLSVGALAVELPKPLYMTAIEASSRIVTWAMALLLLVGVMRLWSAIFGRRVGVLAGVVTATNAVFVYYGHTGTLEIPYLLWVTWALVELERVARGEPRESRFFLFAIAAALTKQTAVAALLLPMPVYLFLVPYGARGEAPWRPRVVRGAAVGIAVYAVVSGALVNPTGYARHLAFTFGPGSQSWARYPPGLAGAAFFVRAVGQSIPRFTSWPVAIAAVVGIVIAWLQAKTREPLVRWCRLLPLCAGLSQALFLHLLGRRTEERFLLPILLPILPYAAVAFDAAWCAWPKARSFTALAGAASLAPALLGVASMDATIVFDPRYDAERYLAALPRGARVELVGGPMFLPRVPSNVVASRPGVEPVSLRQSVPGIEDVVDPAMDPRPRRPDAIVVADGATPAQIVQMTPAFGTMQYRDPVSKAFFAGLLDGSLGYRLAHRSSCSLPWPLECRAIHSSTASEVWIYAPSP